MFKAGRKTLDWNRERAKLKIDFERAGIMTCEFRFDGCKGSIFLGFAHAVKRRFLNPKAPIGHPTHIATVALACAQCHDKLDNRMKAVDMERWVLFVIVKRDLHVYQS